MKPIFLFLSIPLLLPAQPSARRDRVAQVADSLRAALSESRRDFHMHPELSNREERTSRVIAEKLRALGLEVKTGVAKYGVIGLLKGGRPGPVVAMRADMDALPITETLDVPYKSKNVGVKHACGHDVHMAVALGVAETLVKLRDQVPGTVKFIFQPAEEGVPVGEVGGAPQMIQEGVLENPRAGAIFAFHASALLERGQIGFNPGPLLASSDTFTIRVKGKGVHGAYPHMGIDPMPVAAEVIQALQTIRSRRIEASQPLVLTLGRIQGGTRFNIVASEVVLDGTLRTLNEGVREQAKTLMRQILGGVAQAHGTPIELQFHDEGNPVTANDPALTNSTIPELEAVLGKGNAVKVEPQMGAEDFAYFQKRIPGVMYWLGIANKARGITAMIHTADFDADEDALVVGVKAMSNVLLDWLEKNAR
ncbi:MAG TPA: amidohydrolase [Solibacterales bacterium]|nr:amidohydrolase [Bryobacterales bacterium]